MVEETLGLIREYGLPHWPFFFMSFALGIVGQFMKKRVWSWERAQRGGFWEFMHASMGIHAPLAGFIAGIIGFPVSPGIEGALAKGLYHFVAGAMSSYTVAAWKHFMKTKGVLLEESITPPPKTPS